MFLLVNFGCSRSVLVNRDQLPPGYSVLSHQNDSGLAFAFTTAMAQEDVQQLKFLEQQAQQQWHQVGHPGWSLKPLADQGGFATGQLPSPQVLGHITPAAVPVLVITSGSLML